jgi:hypothetical protein
MATKCQLDLIQDALADRLRAAPAVRFPVSIWPNPATNQADPTATSSMRIRFYGFKESPERTGGAAPIQGGSLLYEVLIQQQDVSNHTSLLPLLEFARRRLQGFVPAVAGRYSLKEYGCQFVKGEPVEKGKDTPQWDWSLIVCLDYQYENTPEVLP